MKSNQVHHGPKGAGFSALLSASTFAAVAPRDMSVISTARLSKVDSNGPVVIQNAASPGPHPGLAAVTGRTQVLVRLKNDAVSKENSRSSRGALVADQA